MFYNFFLSLILGHSDRLQSFDKCVVSKEDIIEMIHQDLFEKRFEMISPPFMGGKFFLGMGFLLLPAFSFADCFLWSLAFSVSFQVWS